MVRVDEHGYPVTFEARNLVENQKYDFWVTASTSVGEGEPTSLVTQVTNTRAPARIASFSQTIKVPVGTSLTLECLGKSMSIENTHQFINSGKLFSLPHLKYHSRGQPYTTCEMDNERPTSHIQSLLRGDERGKLENSQR